MTMNVEHGPSRFGSATALALFKPGSQQSLGGVKADDEKRPSTSVRPTGRLRAISRVTWGSVARGLRQSKEQPSIMEGFQQKLHLNADTVVAGLELVIILLSCIQLELSSRSPRWRENKVCERRRECTDMHDEGSFVVPNCLRVAIGVCCIARTWVRLCFLLKQRQPPTHGVSWFKKILAYRLYFLEVLALVIFPYPGLETLLSRDQADIMIFLSMAVGARTICWRSIMYFPYPIRQKEKIATFAGNLEFSYREFVFKKVMDDTPLTKISLVCTIMVTFTTFLLRAIETINGVCRLVEAPDQLAGHKSYECAVLSWSDSIWLISTSFVKLGYGDVVPRSKAGRSVIVASSCVMRGLAAMLVSVIIKKFTNFSSMEARVHAFLFRMDLFNKKDLSAVMAVQASFRFNKSYKRSLMWHKHSSSQLYYRPLSARLPNEVKKKLYVSRFQASLKEIMKFNTDGDPLNSFAKHIEVITAALGITLVEMAQLKKIYYRKSRLLEERQKLEHANSLKNLAIENQANAPLLTNGHTTSDPSSPPGSNQSSPRGSSRNILGGFSSARPLPALPPPSGTSPSNPTISPEWGQSMLQRCEEVLANLQHIEHSARKFSVTDRRSSIVRLDSMTQESG